MSARILVVDDDEVIRETVRLTLELEGYEVATAGDGLEALEALRKGPRPDVVLLDLMMPVVDGWQVAAEVDADPALSSIPIVLVTAYADRSKPMRRAYPVVKKPFELETLLAAVRQACT
jgi:CheY-like chemotaxis protein